MGGTPSKPDIPTEIYNKKWCDVPLVVGDPTLRANINKYVYPVTCPSNPSILYNLTSRQLTRYKYNPDKNVFRKIGKAALGAARASASAASAAMESRRVKQQGRQQTARRSISNMFKGATGRGFYDQTLQLLINDFISLKVKRIKAEKNGQDVSAIDAKINTKKAQMRNHIKTLKLSSSDKAKLNDILNKVYTEDDATLENSLNTENSNINASASAISDISKILKDAALAANTIFKSTDADVIAARTATQDAIAAAQTALGVAHPAANPIQRNVVIPKVKTVLSVYPKISPTKIAYAKQAVIQILSKIDKKLYQDVPEALRLSFPNCIDLSKSSCKENTAERITWDMAQNLLKSGKSEKSSIDKLQADYETALKTQALLKSDQKKLVDELRKVDEEIADLQIDLNDATADNTAAQTDLTAAKAAVAPRVPAPGARAPAFALRNSGSATAELNRAREAASKAQKTLRDLTKAVAKANAKRALIAPGTATAAAAVADAEAQTTTAKTALDTAIDASRKTPGSEEYISAGRAARDAAEAALAKRDAAEASRTAFRQDALTMAGNAVKYGIGVPVLAVAGTVYGLGHVAKGVGQGIYSGNASLVRPAGNGNNTKVPKIAKPAAIAGRVLGRGTRKFVGTVGTAIGTGASIVGTGIARGARAVGTAFNNTST